MSRPVALTIAGSDSGGGAGIQADLKTFQAFGVFGTTAVTAVTAQNTIGVFEVQRIHPEIVAAQIRAVMEDLRPSAAKTGMLADAEIISAVAGELERGRCGTVVVDPVMIATSGDRLLAEEAVEAYRKLLPLSTLLTPNIPEAELLTGLPVRDLGGMEAAARRLIGLGGRAVLIKGGHLAGDHVVDLLHDGDGWHVWREQRIGAGHAHGTGCTLSAAITAGLASGGQLLPAVDRAIRYTRRALRAAEPLGSGARPLEHRVPPDEPSR